MEQSSQVKGEAPVAVPNPLAAEPAGDDMLREELAKWRERVPKLAAALRQRAEEAEALKQEVDRLRRSQAPAPDTPAGIRARDELIEELEGRLRDLSERDKAAQAELHRRQLELDELKHEIASWKSKWQSVTRSLDSQAAEAGTRDQESRELAAANETLRQRLAEQTAAYSAGQRALDEALEERDSLRARNEQLFETTELANRQIGSLTDSLSELRASLKQHRDREAGIIAERDGLQRQLGDLQGRHAEAEATLAREREARASAETRLVDAEQRAAEASDRVIDSAAAAERAERSLTALTEELHLMSSAAAAAARTGVEADARVAEADRQRAEAERRLAELEQARSELEAARDEQTREVARLTGVVEVAQRTTTERENERRELSERLQALEARNDHLEQQLGERSALVVTLEQDQAEMSRRQQALEQERDDLEEARIRAERNVKESAEHVTALNDKLERQKELMERLEEELAEAREEQARLSKSRQTDAAGAEAEVIRLQEQVRKLEGLVRERTEALNRLEWRRQIAGEPADREGADGAAAPPADEDGDAKLLLVLNQQLGDARARNNELLGRIRELEAEIRSGAAAPAVTSTDSSAHSSTPSSCSGGDDLTRIHGVGQKLAEQLNDLGIYRYEQIAGLDVDELADETHVLHGHRGRIVRDGWIGQAVKLIRH